MQSDWLSKQLVYPVTICLNGLMLFEEVISVYSENNDTHK
jgi:hypothetical protein